MRAQTTCSRPSLRPASTILRFSITRTVWPSMSGCNGFESSSGNVGIWPVTKHQPSTSTAWLNGATGVGAPGAMKNIGALIVLSSAGAMAKEQARQAPPAQRGVELGGRHVNQEAGQQPDLDGDEAIPGEIVDRLAEGDREAALVAGDMEKQLDDTHQRHDQRIEYGLEQDWTDERRAAIAIDEVELVGHQDHLDDDQRQRRGDQEV